MKNESAKHEGTEQTQLEHDRRTIYQKLQKLDSKFGIGVGALEERERLNKLFKELNNKEK